jgi:hypothetical protein
MRHATATVGVAVAVCSGASSWAADKPAMSVFFTVAQVDERREVDEATRNALKAKRDETHDARQALEKQLKAQLGKKREGWPPEKDEELDRAEHAEAMADADYSYRQVDLKAMNDGVKDLVRAAEGKGLQALRKDHLTVAASAAEADLVVEVLGRRNVKGLAAMGPKPVGCYLLFSVGAGGRTPAESFARVPADYRQKGRAATWKIAGPRPEKPVFVFETSNGSSGTGEFGCHGAAADTATVVIDLFIEQNYATITGR